MLNAIYILNVIYITQISNFTQLDRTWKNKRKKLMQNTASITGI